MRTTVVTGLLGAGKTTFIRNFLKDRTGKAVVLVNDFGQAGIDGEVISAGGIETIELPSGCVCCTLTFDLITSVRQAIARFGPDQLVIEPSGVASPTGVLAALASAGLPQPSVVGIVDAVEFAELYGSGMYGSFFREQIESSDAVLVNKADLADAGAIAAAERLIGEINPRAAVIRTTNAALDAPLPAGERNAGRSVPLSGERAPCRFETLSFGLKNGIRREAARRIFDELAQGALGTIARAKALVQTSDGPWKFDLAFGKVDEARFEKDIAESRLVVIGQGLRTKALANLVQPVRA